MSHSQTKSKRLAQNRLTSAEMHLRSAKKNAADRDLGKAAKSASWAVESAAEAWVHAAYAGDQDLREKAKKVRRSAHYIIVKLTRGKETSSQRGAGDKRTSKQRLSAALRRDR